MCLCRITGPAFYDPAFWDEVAEARPLFDAGFGGYAAARANPILFTHLVENNRFIVLLAYKPSGDAIGRVVAASIGSTRPVSDNEAWEALREESQLLAAACGAPEAPDADCYYEGASENLRYAYDHIPTDSQENIVRGGKPPRQDASPAS